jgi:uncharacterized integral membrane protein
MIRKILTALILVSLAILFAMFAVANRQSVTISLDPFNQADPAMALPPQPLYLVLLIVLVVGVLLGGSASWLRQSKWRRHARRLEGESRRLRTQSDQRAVAIASPPTAPLSVETPRLTLPPSAA